MRKSASGFTIVELLIVIVVIGVLAAITIVAFNGIQDRARTEKINSDLAMLSKAIQSARILEDGTLYDITGSLVTAGQCVSLASDTDLSDKVAASNCWADYTQFLELISTAGEVNVRNLVDPWGRPYFIDENEHDSTCTRDDIGSYSEPFVTGWNTPDRSVQIPNYRTAC